MTATVRVESVASPLVSILVTSFNQRDYLREALESALNQTYRSIEIVVVDDGSSDGSAEMAADYAKRYPDTIRAIRHARNRGVSAARNSAFAASRGAWITTLDGDDRYHPAKVENELAAATASAEPKVAYSNFQWIDASGRVTGIWDEREQTMPEGHILGEMFLGAFPKSHWGRNELFPRRAIRQVLNDPALAIYEDLELKLRLCRDLTFCYCPGVSHDYRQHGHGLSTSPAGLYYQSLDRIWRRHRSLNVLLPNDVAAAIVRHWRDMLSGHAVSAACQELSRGRRREAFRYLLLAIAVHPASCPPKLLVRCALPRWISGSVQKRS